MIKIVGHDLPICFGDKMSSVPMSCILLFQFSTFCSGKNLIGSFFFLTLSGFGSSQPRRAGSNF